jgi:hypothetical protein
LSQPWGARTLLLFHDMDKATKKWVVFGIAAVGAALLGTPQVRASLGRLIQKKVQEGAGLEGSEPEIQALNTSTDREQIVRVLTPIAVILLTGRRIMVPQLAWIGLGSLVFQEWVRRNPDFIPMLLEDRETRI